MAIKLTSKQEQFCIGIALENLSQAAAYKAAYNCERMSDKVLRNKASAMMKRDDIRVRVAELRAQVVEEAIWSRQDSVEELAAIARAEKGDPKPSEQVSAIRELNAMHGYNEPAKVDVNHRGLQPLTDEDWL